MTLFLRSSQCRNRAGAQLAAFAAAALFSAAVPAQTGAAKVTEYGIYSKDHKLIRTTRTIALAETIRFGFCFEAPTDTTADSVTLVETLSHPPVAGASGIESAGYSFPRMFKVERGVVRGCAGYQARSKADLTPGLWKFTISDGGADLLVQEFTIR